MGKILIGIIKLCCIKKRNKQAFLLENFIFNCNSIYQLAESKFTAIHSDQHLHSFEVHAFDKNNFYANVVLQIDHLNFW